LEKFGISGLPLLHLALNRPVDTEIMHKDSMEDADLKEERVQRLLKFAKDGRMGPAEWMGAMEANCERTKCNWFSFFNTLGEIATILTVFGRTDPSGANHHLTEEDIRDLWVRSKWPKNWNRRPSGYGLTQNDALMASRIVDLLGHLSIKTESCLQKAIRPHTAQERQDLKYDDEVIKSLQEKVQGGRLSYPWDSRLGGVYPVSDVSSDSNNCTDWENAVWNKQKDIHQMDRTGYQIYPGKEGLLPLYMEGSWDEKAVVQS